MFEIQEISKGSQFNVHFMDLPWNCVATAYEPPHEKLQNQQCGF